MRKRGYRAQRPSKRQRTKLLEMFAALYQNTEKELGDENEASKESEKDPDPDSLHRQGRKRKDSTC